MKRSVWILATLLVAGLVFADDEKAEQKLKYPWAGKEMNEQVSMTRLEHEVLKFNAKPLTREEQRMLVKGGKCVVGLTRLHVDAKDKGLVMTGECLFTDPDKEMFGVAAGYIRRHLSLSRTLLGTIYDKEKFPVGVRVVYKGKVVCTRTYTEDS
ncbi:MAG: hypothetical protein ACLFV7_07095 [Phycisphaerae bacterium]